MFCTLMLAVGLCDPAQTADLSTKLSLRTTLNNLDFWYRVFDATGRELTEPEVMHATSLLDPRDPRRMEIFVPRSENDGDRAVKRIVVLERMCALSVVVVVENLRPGNNYLREVVPVTLGDIAPQFDKDGKPVRTDDVVDEQDLKMVEDYVREGRSGMNRKYHGLPWMFADVNFDWELDAKDVAIVKANLGKMAPKVGPIGKMKPAPKVYVATQRRPR